MARSGASRGYGFRHHVSVIELDRGVLEERRFVVANPRSPRKARLYVGLTGRTPEACFRNHKKG